MQTEAITGKCGRVSGAGRRGMALVIVLALVVLLTGLVIAFFSRSLIDRQMSESNISRAKVTNFADGAANAIIGNLKQEIVLSSSYPLETITTGTIVTTIYRPASPAAMLPQLTGSNLPLNLLLYSNPSQQFYTGTSGTIPMNATELSSTVASLNGRYVSPARWNEHYLMPLLTSTNDSTPIMTGNAPFVPPSWILVARDGSNPTVWNANMTAAGSNTSAIVGRYAYAVYHEGGLLDVNAAGYPSSSGTLAAYKDGLSYADLTQVFAAAGIPGATGTSCVDQLVAWRNGASVPATNPFSPGFTFTSNTNSAGNYNNVVGSNTTGFLTVSSTVANNNETDRMFGSRQQLIKFAKNVWGFSTATGNGYLDVLNYLTTFTRDVNQPSYAPDPSRPLVQGSNNGGNNAQGLDNVINPDFLSVRVATTVPRGRDDGTDLVQGEPLVKKRFALNRLAWLTCMGPSALRVPPLGTGTDPDIVALEAAGISQAWLALGTDDGTQDTNIPKYFGLTWDTTHHYWKYLDGRDTPLGPIRKLYDPTTVPANDVVSVNREPNFFELLKAAIDVGSIGKTLTSGSGSPATGPLDSAYLAQYGVDSSVDAAIIQIGANIIAQYATDSYPRIIYFNDGSAPAGSANEYPSVENLPYIYRTRNAVIKVAAPQLTTNGNPYYAYATNPNISGSSDLTESPSGSDRSSGTPGIDNQSIANTGVGAFMQYVDLWNPHDYNPNNLAQSMGVVGPMDQPGPQFRLYVTTAGTNPSPMVVTAGPYGVSAGSYVASTGSSTNPVVSGSDNANSPGFHSVYGFPWAGEERTFTEANTEMTFQITRSSTGAALFREPTVLFQPGLPSGSNLAATAIQNISPSLGIIAANPSFFAPNGGLASAVGYNDGTELPTQYTGYIGIYFGSFPLTWWRSANSPSRILAMQNAMAGSGANLTYTLQCKDAYGNWITYDQKGETFTSILDDWIMYAPETTFIDPMDDSASYALVVDPRTSRFGLMDGYPPTWAYLIPPFPAGFVLGDKNYESYFNESPANMHDGWLNQPQGIVLTDRDGFTGGINAPTYEASGTNSNTDWAPIAQMGWFPGGPWDPTGLGSESPTESLFRVGMLSENDPHFAPPRSIADQIGDGMDGVPGNTGVSNPIYYSDPDGVVRRAAGAYNTVSTAGTNYINMSSNAPGLPLATANDNGTARSTQSNSRPVVLNRPFRSVSELGYVFSGTPWKNLDFFTPESGYAALLDLFCIQDTSDPGALAAGKVNLNTQQWPVLQAMISGAYKDLWTSTNTIPSGADAEASQIAGKLAARTSGQTMNGQPPAVSGSANPLENLSDLVGKWKGPSMTKTLGAPNSPPSAYDGAACYDGFSGDLSYVLTTGTETNIQRYREAAMRALTAGGQTRVWNLMIDLVAQVGRYPQSANSLNQFIVEGEEHYWVHVAIDRLTGNVIDKQVEVVKE